MAREEIHRLLDWALDMGQKLVERHEVPEAKQHFENAKREMLLGARSMVDAAISHIDREQAAKAGPTTITIE